MDTKFILFQQELDVNSTHFDTNFTQLESKFYDIKGFINSLLLKNPLESDKPS